MRILPPPVPSREDWSQDWDWEWDVLMAPLAEIPILNSMIAIMPILSLGRRCPNPPSSIGSIPGPVPPNRSCFVGMYLNTATTVIPCGWTQTCTAVPSLPGVIDGTLWQGMGHTGGGV